MKYQQSQIATAPPRPLVSSFSLCYLGFNGQYAGVLQHSEIFMQGSGAAGPSFGGTSPAANADKQLGSSPCPLTTPAGRCTLPTMRHIWECCLSACVLCCRW